MFSQSFCVNPEFVESGNPLSLRPPTPTRQVPVIPYSRTRTGIYRISHISDIFFCPNGQISLKYFHFYRISDISDIFFWSGWSYFIEILSFLSDFGYMRSSVLSDPI